MMTVAAVIELDLSENPLGLRSRALEPVAGRPVLALTLERLRRCSRIGTVALLAEADQHQAIRKALGETLGSQTSSSTSNGVRVSFLDRCGLDPSRRGSRGSVPATGAPASSHVDSASVARAGRARRQLLRRARKWALANWAGGLLGATVFDEFGGPDASGDLAQAAEALNADTVVPVPAEWALLDPALLDAAIDHHLTSSGSFGFTFNPAPPGLAPPVYSRERLRKWADDGLVLGDILRYSPQAPRVEFTLEPCFFRVPAPLARCEHRLAADTARGLALVRAVVDALGPEAGAEEVCGFLAAHPQTWPGDHPREVEVELTTRRPVADALRPLPPVAEAEMALDDAVRLIREMAAGDDTLLTLGGRGDPLLHPEFPAVLRAARDAGVFGVHVVTYGHGLTDELARTLIETGIDAVTFLLDAWSARAYAATKGGADFEVVQDGLRRLGEARQSAGADWPVVVVELMKTAGTLPEMESFYDNWLKAGAWPVIRGPSTRGGLVEDLAVVSMAPAKRTPALGCASSSACRRLFRRLTVQATGEVPACEEDVLCRQVLGNALREGLAAVWRGRPLADLRRAHLAGDVAGYAPCEVCREWHRP